MGKTALALTFGRAQQALGVWTDGVWLVELRNITSAAQARPDRGHPRARTQGR